MKSVYSTPVTSQMLLLEDKLMWGLSSSDSKLEPGKAPARKEQNIDPLM